MEAHGYIVATAATPAEAIEHASGSEFDLLVTDVVMPGMDGFELHREISKRISGIKVVFISGNSRDSMSREEDKGVLLGKPFTPQGLADAVRLALSQS